MIVCVCKAISDRHIRSAVNEGASTLRDITRELKVGTCCGKCVPEAKATLAACLSQCGAMRAAAETRVLARTDGMASGLFAGAAGIQSSTTFHSIRGSREG